MKSRKLPVATIAKTATTALLLLLIGWLSLQIWNPWRDKETDTTSTSIQFDAKGQLYQAVIPQETSFHTAAENDKLKLLVDRSTSHFQLVDKATGSIWRSYPNPHQWPKETATGTWKNHLLSPILIEYVNARNYKSSSFTAGLIDTGGYLEQFQMKEDGFNVTFAFPKAQMKIPVEVTLHSDYVETRVIDAGIMEGELSLLNVKLYPLFGAEPSVGQDGYIMLPDGTGSLIRFNEKRIMPQLTYDESVYGQDLSFYNEETDRQRITMPVYGMKSGDQSFLSIITEGEAYANIYAAPGGAVGRSNWVTTEWQYRKKFYQSVSRSTGEGFYMYSSERFVSEGRATRYYPLTGAASDYSGMAAVYRNYLMSEQGVKPIPSTKDDIPLYLDIVGADIEKGLFTDSYLKATTTDEAAALLKSVYDLGIHNIQVHYAGWQKDGYSSQGGYFPVDKRIGGNNGMKKFIDYAHSLNIPVYLTANYTLNNNGEDRFWWRRDGLRNMAGTVLKEQKEPKNEQEEAYYVSPGFYEKVVRSDLNRYKKLGADGIYFENGIGEQLNTDFNSRYKDSRSDTVSIQRNILEQTRKTLGSVSTGNVNFYALDTVDHVHQLASDYSYDVFVTEPIPFAAIVLHGLRTYTLEWSNIRDEWQSQFLRSIEYGASPAYIVSGDNSDDMRRSYSLWYYSLDYTNWISRISDEYKQVNAVLAQVKDCVITQHRFIAPGVNETVYDGGYSVLVNYNDEPYDTGNLVVPAHGYAVKQGGETR
ncbi:DUF5696 domain-containing protein [Paenibacillus xylaniclasticus]|uniref:DUF5696 domain-containing protein n=1 Tax=Paenibacillus xylaniclasticus TaxID=588083 RepID=UPI000FDAA186|nr:MULTISPECIES: DUF5696 domain-containing protein [Paenibacillus]GFN31723.1 hypothetical protein PCURB6_19830 [Paenibacillus curdlanolyticus]